MQYNVVGLGNPGERYEYTRHNVGRLVVRAVHSLCGTGEWKKDARARAYVAEGVTDAGDSIRFVLPDAFMNRSGDSVRPCIKNEDDLTGLIVVHDDIDLPEGVVRIAYDRGSGGHNGVRSIEDVLKSRAFCRVRVGVLPCSPHGVPNKPRAGKDVEDFILRPLEGDARLRLEGLAEYAVGAVVMLMRDGKESTMLRYHTA
jgi:peptidyl-tRNA hydrolase, PTH1 family